MKRSEKAFLLGAMAAPLAQTATRCGWPAVGLTALACGILCRGLKKWCRDTPGWSRELSWIWGILLLGQGMSWAGSCWQGDWIPEILLLLAAWTAWKGREKTAGAVLLWPMALLLGLVILAGLGEMKPETLRPRDFLPVPLLIPVLLMPARTGGTGGGWMAVLFAVVIQGIPGTDGGAASPFYELGRSLSLPGTSERFESLIAVGLTLGYYVTACWLLSREEGRGRILPAAAAALTIHLAGLTVPPEWTAVGTLLIWVLIPLFSRLKRI